MLNGRDVKLLRIMDVLNESIAQIYDLAVAGANLAVSASKKSIIGIDVSCFLSAFCSGITGSKRCLVLSILFLLPDCDVFAIGIDEKLSGEKAESILIIKPQYIICICG